MPSQFDIERQAQISAARSMKDTTVTVHNETTHRPTLATRPGYQGKRPQDNRGKPVSRPGPKGHDAIIKDLTQRQARVVVYTRENMNDAAAHVGVITGSDRYTISLRLDDAVSIGADNDAKILVIYKHAMQGFAELKPYNLAA